MLSSLDSSLLWASPMVRSSIFISAMSAFCDSRSVLAMARRSSLVGREARIVRKSEGAEAVLNPEAVEPVGLGLRVAVSAILGARLSERELDFLPKKGDIVDCAGWEPVWGVCSPFF
ncbi:hypothetical protein XENTR_v10016889 [Xenopus tropicalis]|nr:hypothetical protein XENTR_v10016889 [Xenopus tropicalis]